MKRILAALLTAVAILSGAAIATSASAAERTNGTADGLAAIFDIDNQKMAIFDIDNVSLAFVAIFDID